MTRKEFAAVAALLTAYYPHKLKLDDHNTLEVWYQELADLPGEAVLAAVRHMARKSTDWPSIAAVRQYAEPVDDVVQLWQDTVKTVCEYGPYGKWSSDERQALFPDFSAEQRAGLTRCGGVVAILEAKDQVALDQLGRRFQKAVQELRDFVDTQKLQMEALMGSSKTTKHSILAVQDGQEGLSGISQVISDVTGKLKA